ncbi:MAG: hypothetical protein FWD65_03955 [Coriobacteriia bacterium]|nr:hypothetical protein [Coriobacteriia bacterium]
MSRFSIKILSQNWLVAEHSEYDRCSHGTLQLSINNIPITDPKSYDDTYGISEAALGLLRTLEQDYEPDKNDRLIPHGCGLILMMGCLIGINWRVIHSGDQVLISDVVRYDEMSLEPTRQFPEAETVIDNAEYRAEILRFAREVKEFFDANPHRRFKGVKGLFKRSDKKQEYKEFWREFNDIYQRQSLL